MAKLEALLSQLRSNGPKAIRCCSLYLVASCEEIELAAIELILDVLQHGC